MSRPLFAGREDGREWRDSLREGDQFLIEPVFLIIEKKMPACLKRHQLGVRDGRFLRFGEREKADLVV